MVVEKNFVKTVAPYIAAIAFGAIGGFSLWYWGVPDASDILEKRDKARRAKALENLEIVEGEGNRAAIDYVRTLQSGQCESAIELTSWMQERLRNAKMAGASTDRLLEIRQDLCERLTTRTPEGNQLAQEGVEDQYIFNPTCTWKVVGLDDGREGLSERVNDRTWFEVAYSSKVHSLRDIRGAPIKSLVVGVNISERGHVLKAGVIGNVDIDLETLSYSWNE